MASEVVPSNMRNMKGDQKCSSDCPVWSAYYSAPPRTYHGSAGKSPPAPLTGASTNAQHSSLLRLPAELRYMIYKKVYTEEVGVYCIPDSYGNERRYGLFRKESPPKPGYRPRYRRWNTLKLVCRDLYWETKGLGVYPNTLIFPDLGHEWASLSCWRFIKKLWDTQRKRIRHLIIHETVTFRTERTNETSEVRAIQALAAYCRHNPSITVTLSLRYPNLPVWNLKYPVFLELYLPYRRYIYPNLRTVGVPESKNDLEMKAIQACYKRPVTIMTRMIMTPRRLGQPEERAPGNLNAIPYFETLSKVGKLVMEMHRQDFHEYCFDQYRRLRVEG